ncbi:hypothetical protein Taro_033991 [Colocasia esculenta]|uniref:Uncharacterized protein n=1 Tax=Colocasia esculenta TaxID=4460 RepID=A0A843VWL8_COLES|nr:hypothetical protein [Colocasia esculenta]
MKSQEQGQENRELREKREGERGNHSERRSPARFLPRRPTLASSSTSRRPFHPSERGAVVPVVSSTHTGARRECSSSSSPSNRQRRGADTPSGNQIRKRPLPRPAVLVEEERTHIIHRAISPLKRRAQHSTATAEVRNEAVD